MAKKRAEEKKATTKPADRFERVSVGLYRDSTTGKLVKSSQDPDRKTSSAKKMPEPAAPVQNTAATAAQPTTITAAPPLPPAPQQEQTVTGATSPLTEALSSTQSTPPAPAAAAAPAPAAAAANVDKKAQKKARQAAIDEWVRVGPGQYKNKKTGKVVKSAQNPGRTAKLDTPAPAPAAPAPETPAAPPAPVLPNDQNPQTPQDNIPLKPVDISNPTAVVNAGIEANVGVAQKSNEMNNANQDLTYGKQTVTFDENGRPTITQERSAPEEQKYQQDVGIETSANQRIQDALSNYQSLFSQPFDVSADRKRVEDQIYGRNKQLLDEQFQQSDEEFEQTLAQRGIPPGSPLDNQMRQQYARQKADAYSSARNDAISQGRTEQAALSGLDLQRRQQGMSEMSGLYGLGMGVRDQQFQGFQGQSVTPVDTAGVMSGYYSLGQNNQLRRDELAQQNQQFGQTLGENRRQFDKKLVVDQKAVNNQAPRDPLADYKAKGEIDWANKQRELEWVKNNQPKGPGTGAAVANIVGNVGSAFVNGLGQSVGQSFFGK